MRWLVVFILQFLIMNKLMLIWMLDRMGSSLYSCRETTQENTQDAVEAIGEDMESNTKKAADKIEEGAKKVKSEVQEGIDSTKEKSENWDDN